MRSIIVSGGKAPSKELLKEYIKDNQNSFIELFINAPSKCRYKSIEIFLEAESLNIIEDRKYLESKLA